jgi:hypothetical protein
MTITESEHEYVDGFISQEIEWYKIYHEEAMKLL